MKKLAILAAVPIFAGYLCAQQPQAQNESSSSKTTTTWNGTLVNAGCRSTVTHNKESRTGENTTTTTETNSSSTQCPLTQQTTTFGIVTPDGHYMALDEPGNTQVVQMIHKHHKWTTYIDQGQPVKVRVVGTPDGDTIVVRQIQ